MNCSTPGFPVLHHLLEFAQRKAEKQQFCFFGWKSGKGQITEVHQTPQSRCSSYERFQEPLSTQFLGFPGGSEGKNLPAMQIGFD